MRILLAGILLLVSSVLLKAQYYQLFGDQIVNLCENGEGFYALEVDFDITRTDWTVLPGTSAIITTSDTHYASVLFTAPGTYILVATSYNANNQIFSDSISIVVSGLNLNYEVFTCGSIDPISKCYQVCAFSDTEIYLGSGSNYTWIVSGASSYTFSPPGLLQIVWGSGGPGSVIIQTTGQCQAEICFDIFPLPVAEFSATPGITNDTITICKNQSITFHNESFNGIEYEWQFGDGTSSNEFHPAHIYNEEGYYSVTLVANSICDCSDEKTIVVEVLPKPAPTLDCVNSVCPGGRQRYMVSATDCSDFYWTVSSNGTIVNGGTPGDDFIEIIWNEGPDGYIELTVGGCSTDYCSYTNRFRVPVISGHGPISGDVVVCAGEITTYSAPYFPGTVYSWNVGSLGKILGDRTRSSVTVRWADVSVPGTSEVQVTYDNCFLGCGGSDLINVTISPYFQIAGDVEVCAGQEATVNATGGFGMPTSAIVQWSLENSAGDEVASGSSPSASWSYTFNVPPGIYEWVARNTSSSYCNEIARLSIRVSALPEPPTDILGEQQICPGVIYGYTIQPTGSFHTQWVVTDGTSTFAYTGQSIQHAFGITPPYQVMAYNSDVQNSNCTSDSLIIDLETVGDIIISGKDEVCLNQIELYEATLATGVEYTWEIIPSDHGEIKRSEIHKAEVFFSETGSATIRVTACGMITDFPVYVNALPSIVLPSPLSACSNEQVQVTTNLGGLVHSWKDEADVVLSTIDQIDLFPGAYSVEVTDANGCIGDKAFQITTYPAPEVSISTPHSTLYCVTLPGGLNIYANTDGVDYSFEWFQNGVSLGTGGPIWNVTDFGDYHVVVTNQYGCSSASGIISFGSCCPPMDCGSGVPGLPGGCNFIEYDLDITRTDYQCDEHEFAFDAAQIVPGTGAWVLESASDGIITFEVADIFNYPYTKPGYYYLVGYAELAGFVYPPGSCFHLERMIDTIRAVADFTYTGKCANTVIEFEDLTTFLPGETIASWTWNFGDPTSGIANTSTLQHPTHTFSIGGIYTVTLQVTLASGCTTTHTFQIQISDGPVFSPIYDPLHCENEAMAMYGGNNLFNVVWDFGDPSSGVENTAVEDSVFHTYTVPGNYIVTIQAEDIYGCPGLGTLSIDIVPNTLNGDILIVPPTICFGDTATLTAAGGGISWAWSTGETTEQIESSVSQQFNVLITDQYHCTYSPPSVFLEVLPEPVVIVKGRIIYADGSLGPWTDTLILCAGSEYEISAFSNTIVNYQWDNGATGPTLKFTNEAGTIPSPGDYTYTVVATDINNGCISKPSSLLVTIHALPEEPFIQLTSGSGCSLQANTLTVTNPQPGIQYLWSDGQEGIEITVYNSGFFYVIALNAEGCSAQSNALVIDPSANVDQLPGGCYLLCDPAEVCVPEIQNVASYIFYHNGNVIESGSGAPTDVVLSQDGTYYFEVTSLNGCVATSDPLDVQLYTGIGDITVETWLDLDGDGSGDVLLPGITVVIESGDGMHKGKTETVVPGQFIFTEYPSAEYIAFFDPALFPSQYKTVVDSVQLSVLTCGDSVVVQLVLEENCTVQGVDVNFSICHGEQITLGDSVWTEAGMYEMHLHAVSGCDSVFQVIITESDSIVLHALVWFDVDQSGSITPADTLLDAIAISVYGYFHGAGGTYFSDGDDSELAIFKRDSFIVTLDPALLPVNFNAVIGEEIVDDTVCGSAIVQLLVGSNCPAVQLIQNVSLCQGDSVFINGTWYFDEATYSYIVTDPVTLCDTLFEYHIMMIDAPEITGEVIWNCIALGSIELSVTGQMPFSYNWSHGPIGEGYVGDLSPGEYIVTVTDGNGCISTDTFYVDGNISLLNFDIQQGFSIHQGDSVLIEIEGDVQEPGLLFQWVPSAILTCDTCVGTFAHPITSTDIIIIITDANNCTYELATFIEVIPTDEIFAPNVFTPNADGINDMWTLVSKLNRGVVHTLEVFDRWGNLVYKTGNIDFPALTGWDGKFKGKLCQAGVYAYKASVTLGDGRDMLLKGDITLVR